MGKEKSADIVGTRIGIFDVMYECDHKSSYGHRLFHVKCVYCGWETDMKMHFIKYTKICKHLTVNGEYVKERTWKVPRLGTIYRSMITRCYDANNKSYRWYGGKGITVCDEWLSSSALFENWALQNGYNDDLTIDRIDENIGYCPENCRWVTNIDNAKYKSTTNMIVVDGVEHTGKDWSTILGLGVNAVNRIYRSYGEDVTVEFIRRRLKNPEIEYGNINLVKAYGII